MTDFALPRRRFGRTELEMPIFSCGGMRYQEHWDDPDWDKISAANQANLERTILRSVEVGINHIETARGYGSSERQLGRILPTLPRDKILVQTKIAPNEGKEFLETFNTSMDRLQLEYVDLLSLHGINLKNHIDLCLKSGGCLEVIRSLQREGRVRFVGFSTHGPCEVIEEALRTGEFDYVNLHWYWINQANWPAIEEATRQDAGVFIISPNDKGGKLYAPPPKLVELCHPYSPMVFNDLFCLSRPEVHTLSLGAARPSDFDEHLHAASLLDRAPEIVPPLCERLHRAMEEVHGPGWARFWTDGIPPVEEVPGFINLREILRLWVFATGLDMVDFAQMRYNLFGGAGHWFPGNKAADFDEAAIRACVAASPHADRIPSILRESHRMMNGEDKKPLSKE